MNIKQDIIHFLAEVGWRPSRLAREAGLRPNSITRLINGDRNGLSSQNVEKLWPFLYGDQRPEPKDQGAAVG